ncbi:MAG: endonuclease NucS domain-containing protein, partial [Gammaproteobacteria bacterium]
MSMSINYWCFSNRKKGYYEGEWDISTILEKKQYYLNSSESNLSHVKKGDQILLREYGLGSGFWGTCEISDKWHPDPRAKKKYDKDAGWFPISEINKWDTTLPYELIRTELSSRDHRSRIVRLEESDFDNIKIALTVYQKLGYGPTVGKFFLLESGLEEAVKENLSQLNLTLFKQQYDMGPGVGRSDLICRDKDGNFVVLELKAEQSSDDVVGQILRYMGYVQETWAKPEGKTVSGIILTPSFDERLR